MKLDTTIRILENAQKIIKEQEVMINLLKAKIDFLEKNPIIKYTFIRTPFINWF